MQIGMIGLGRMGGNMALRLIQAGHSVVGYNRNPQNIDAAVKAAVVSVPSVAELVKRLKTPRAVWLMVPHEIGRASCRERVYSIV
jgi:6-phosphogluconate dehydrogenase